MKKIISFCHYIVSLFVFTTIIILILFMMAKFMIAFREVIIFPSIFNAPPQILSEMNEIFLQSIATTIVMVKAYGILVSYVKTHHINIKYLVEIAIIAPVIEIIFSSSKYETYILAIFAFMSSVFLFLYLFYYETFQKIDKDYKVKIREKA